MPDNPYREAAFMLSAHTLQQCPPDRGREVAFVGRSNVGKSSVINSLTGRKSLARISKTPGRTRELNYFQLPGEARLVDLPGYGFARVPQSQQEHWARTINAYLQRRQSLSGLVLILDVRREPREEDLRILQWCHAAGLPVTLLLNKADKLSRNAARQALAALQSELGPAVEVRLYSASKRSGLEELRTRLDAWLYPETEGSEEKKSAPAEKGEKHAGAS